MRKFLLVSALSIVALTSGKFVLAGGHGDGGAVHVGGPISTMSPMHNAGAVNGNGGKAADRDTGLGRAEDRRDNRRAVKKRHRRTHHGK